MRKIKLNPRERDSIPKILSLSSSSVHHPPRLQYKRACPICGTINARSKDFNFILGLYWVCLMITLNHNLRSTQINMDRTGKRDYFEKVISNKKRGLGAW